MLTLQELKRIVDVPGFEVKLPTAKQLRTSRSAIAQERLGLDSEISAYQSGHVLYQVGKHFTVFPLHSCRDYLYLADRKTVILPERFFKNRDWYLRLVLEGEDRLECFLQRCIRGLADSEKPGGIHVRTFDNARDSGGNIGEFIGKAEICHSKILPAGRNTGADFKRIRHQPTGGILSDFPGNPLYP